MKKMDLTPYNVGETKVNVKETIVALLFNTSLRLSMREVIVHDVIAKKIEAANGSVLLEDVDYDRVKAAFEGFSGYGRGDLQLIERVLKAESVNVKEV